MSSYILMTMLSGLRSAIGTSAVDTALKETVVTSEYVLARTQKGARNVCCPQSQEAADAWYHKATVYGQIFPMFSDMPTERRLYLQAGWQCVNNSLRNPQFAQPQFRDLRKQFSKFVRGPLVAFLVILGIVVIIIMIVVLASK